MNAVIEDQKRVTLYYREGSSDKVYQTAIEPAGASFVVNFAYGRRGSTLATGTKTSSPVDLDTATKIFTKVVNEKKAKGYTEGEAGTPHQHTDKLPSGILPQLLNPIEESDVERLLNDDAFCIQEKMDGHHKMIRKTGDVVEGINKKGLIVGLPETIVKTAQAMIGSFILDGEQIGDVFHAFDALKLDGRDLRGDSYIYRLRSLEEFMPIAGHDAIRTVPTAHKRKEKWAMFDQLKIENREGAVLKRLDAHYLPGKPKKGGAQFKFKFVATLSAIVAKINVQRSVELSLLNGRSLTSCGNVTIPPNHEIPKVGTVVEVRYLYAHRESDALHQPVYIGPRHDVEPRECIVQQLKYKAT